MPKVSAVEPRCSSTASPSAGSPAAALASVSVGLMTVFSRASVRNPLSARSCSMAMTSVAIASRSAAYLAASWSTISRDAAHAVAELQHFDRDLVRRQHALRRQDDPDLPRLIEFQPGMPRQHRPARLADTDVAARASLHRFASLSLGTNAPGGTWPST